MRRTNILLLIFTLFFCFCNSPEKENAKQNFVSIRASQDPENLNPVNYNSALSSEIINLLYQSLLTIDPESKQIKPLLAVDLPLVTKSDSQSVFTFRIHPAARWADNKIVSGEDVAFSLKLLRGPLLNNQRTAERFFFIKDIELDERDKSVIRLICDKYNSEMDLMTGDFAVLPRHLVDPKGLLTSFSFKELTLKYDSLADNPKIKEFAEWFNSDRFTRNKQFLKGSGGYELDAWNTGQFVRLKKKQNWWGDKPKVANSFLKAHPERITYHIIPENATALMQLRSQQLDVYPSLPITAYQQLAQDKSFTQHYNLYTPESYYFSYMGLNGRSLKFEDVRTRQALAYLLDVDLLIKATQSGFATRTVGPVIPSDNRFYNSAIKPYTYNLEKAKALLSAAGWEKKEDSWQKRLNGEWVPLTINLNYKAGDTELQNIALIFKQAAAKANIPVNIEPMEGLLLTNKLKSHDFDMFIRWLSGNQFVFNYKTILHTESATEGGGNYTGFGTPESDQLIDLINETSDLREKAKLLKEFQAILHEQSNLIFLYFSKERIAVHNRFKNTKISGIKPGYDVSAFTLKE